MRIALFDLDHTLLSGDSDHAWAQFLVDRGVVDREQYEARNNAFYADYKAGTLDIHAFLDFQLKPLSEHPRKVLDAWHAEFMATCILPMITPKAREAVAMQLAQSDLVAIITATNSFVTAPIAREFGVPHLIATEPEIVSGEFTGRVVGEPCFQAGKILRLEAFLAARGLAWTDVTESWFYSDSRNDLPLLQKVTHPVAVNADAFLRDYANAHDWPVVSFA